MAEYLEVVLNLYFSISETKESEKFAGCDYISCQLATQYSIGTYPIILAFVCSFPFFHQGIYSFLNFLLCTWNLEVDWQMDWYIYRDKSNSLQTLKSHIRGSSAIPTCILVILKLRPFYGSCMVLNFTSVVTFISYNILPTR